MCLPTTERTLVSPEGANWLRSDSLGPPDPWPSAGDSCQLESITGWGHSRAILVISTLLPTGDSYHWRSPSIQGWGGTRGVVASASCLRQLHVFPCSHGAFPCLT